MGLAFAISGYILAVATGWILHESWIHYRCFVRPKAKRPEPLPADKCDQGSLTAGPRTQLDLQAVSDRLKARRAARG